MCASWERRRGGGGRREGGENGEGGGWRRSGVGIEWKEKKKTSKKKAEKTKAEPFNRQLAFLYQEDKSQAKE
jgi:hypothetical protein